MTSDLKNSCTIINKVFEEPNFFEYLCQLSNNNIEEVIENISIIINYYGLVYTFFNFLFALPERICYGKY